MIQKTDFEKYLVRRDIQGLTKQWQSQCKKWLLDYFDFVKWKIDEDKTLEYCQQLKNSNSLVYYKKQVYQIRRYLEYLQITWASSIALPPDPNYLPKRVSPEDIKNTLLSFKDHEYYLQIKALILLGATSGLRAEELYQLTPEDIDVEERIVRINHNPTNGQTTKTGRSRVSFFNQDAQEAIHDFLVFFNNGSRLKKMFYQSHVTRIFSSSSLKVKDLRKFFSQEWERNCGPTGAKKLLMGHSGDVDLNHYNAQSEDDLKKIYDNVLNQISLF